MAWEVEFSDEFGRWWDGLNAFEQKSVDFTVSLLQQVGPTLKMPHSSAIEMSRHTHMRESEGRPYRIPYAFTIRPCCALSRRGNGVGTGGVAVGMA
jgi:hypothetical protein